VSLVAVVALAAALVAALVAVAAPLVAELAFVSGPEPSGRRPIPKRVIYFSVSSLLLF
jgi:hypothetical protein